MTIIIKSKREGFRRGGVAHPKAATEYPDDHFTVKQMALIEAEPMLTVTRADVPYNEGDMVVTGQVVEGAPVDEADFLAWLEEKTEKDLKGICGNLDIAVPAKATKADIVALINDNTAFSPADTAPEA